MVKPVSWITMIVLLAAGAKAAVAAPPGELRLEELERRAVDAYRKVRPAIVWITSGEDGRDVWESGVIVSADGYVLTKAIPAGVRLKFLLPDGRSATGTALGWSREWNVGLARIAEKGRWPHVKLSERADVRAGQYCLAVGYASPNRETFIRQPSLRIGQISRSTPDWFMSTCTLTEFGFPGIFDLHGQLAGLTSAIWTRQGAVHTRVSLIGNLWDDLVQGRNLDRARLFPSGPLPRPAGTKDPAPGAIEKASNATVSIWTIAPRIPRAKQRHLVSGGVVTADGCIITCAHHFLMPGERVTVVLSDGRVAAGVVSGTSLMCDISVIKLTDQGPWPHLEMGDSISMQHGDSCLIVGYPAHLQDQQPLVRKTKIIEPKEWSCLLRTSSRPLYGGDSGGGVFDAEGRVVAVIRGRGSGEEGNEHCRIELFRIHWKELSSGQPIDAIHSERLADLTAALRKTTDALPPFAVEVLGDREPRAVGTIVSQDGLILTKASELTGAVACRLPDGRVLPASVQKISSERDLAILKVEAGNLPVAKWSKLNGLPAGLCAAALLPGKSPLVGFVSYATRPIPPEQGNVGVSVADSGRGLEVTDVNIVAGLEGGQPSPLRKADVILSINGQPTPTLKAYLNLLAPEKGEPIAFSGDWVQVQVNRGGRMVELRFRLYPPTGPRPEGQSRRCSGFPRAFDVDIPLTPNLCGGPVIDRTGRVVGVAIACRNEAWTMVLPADQVRAVSWAHSSGSPKSPTAGAHALPEAASLAAKYPGDVGIERDPAVLFAENSETGSITDIGKRWDEVSNKEGKVLALSSDVPGRSRGTRSLQVTGTLGENSGGHLYTRFRGVDRAFLRFYTKFAADHAYEHHFVELGGYNPPTPWPNPRAGTCPQGDDRVGVFIDPIGWYGRFPPPGVWGLYTYWPDMKVSADGMYWGNVLGPAQPVPVPRGQWLCVELMVKLNSAPEKADLPAATAAQAGGELALWIDGKLVMHFAKGRRRGPWSGMGFSLVEAGGEPREILRQGGDGALGNAVISRGEPFEGLRLRTSTDLKINHLWLEHYVDEGAQRQNKLANPSRLNTVWFDDIVVSTKYVGPIQN